MDNVEIVQDDITKLKVDAIVNAGNPNLSTGGGVTEAIFHAAGADELLKECRALGGCATGQAKITKGYQLPAKYIIHTVGPIWQGGNHDEAKFLALCYNSCLTLAIQHHIKTIAFPAISCGIYGYPVAKATPIAVATVKNFFQSHSELDKVIFCCFSQDVFEAYQKAIYPA